MVFSTIDLPNWKDDSLEMLGVEVPSDNEKFTIINIYRHLNCNTPAQFYEDLMRFGDSKVNCIFIGNYNAHHSHWGCSNTDHAGKLVLALIENHYACILNDQRPTLFLPSNSGLSVIDLTIATANMAPLCEVCTEEDTWGSDHYSITVRIGISLVLRQWYAYKINLNTKELIDFQDILAGSYDSFVNNLKEACIRLTNHLVDTAIACSSSSKNINSGTIPVSNERTAPSWTECQEAIIKCRKAARIWQKNFYNQKLL